jgi:hypothetical protein
MQPSDALILTQPLGTGTLFAADMQKKAKGRWIEHAIAHMIQPSAAAMQCFRQHGVTACTDVTGFGLLGHLLEMVEASQVSVSLDLQDLAAAGGRDGDPATGHRQFSSNHKICKRRERSKMRRPTLADRTIPSCLIRKRRGAYWQPCRAIAPLTVWLPTARSRLHHRYLHWHRAAISRSRAAHYN